MKDIKQRIYDFYVKTDGKPTFSQLEDFIYDNQWVICKDYERQCHLDDIKNELEYMKEEGKINKIPTEEEIEVFLEEYEDKLSDSEEWNYILREVIRTYINET